ncbi:LytR C-terminal domain-containing protein [Marisediminicola senii]|uniref:LytR C-terminal domain-containing protein n=1 Tax=Marisediminicola senii TaxID=2711233 RepID=UPI0013EDF06B|nr:LytR C-terminal domain-containing protein [Marisediminicola senii]
MPTSYPPDRFDTLPDDIARIGAHRAPPAKGRGWIAFAWAALATGILVAIGVVALVLFTNSINFDLPSGDTATSPSAEASEEPAEETVEPRLDATIPITVLNGTSTSGLAGSAGDRLVEEGWEGAAIGVGNRANADASDIETTVVYYSDAANEAAALALVESLGVGDIRQSTDYPQSPLVVLLGADYAPGA